MCRFALRRRRRRRRRRRWRRRRQRRRRRRRRRRAGGGGVGGGCSLGLRFNLPPFINHPPNRSACFGFQYIYYIIDAPMAATCALIYHPLLINIAYIRELPKGHHRHEVDWAAIVDLAVRPLPPHTPPESGDSDFFGYLESFKQMKIK